jgi:poly(A) polymerase
MLWYPLEAYAERLMESRKLSYYDAILEASNYILDEQVKSTAIPRRHTATIREIWQLQLRLPRRHGKRAFRLLELNKFRAGFDFLEMRGEIEGGDTQQLAQWWHTFQHTNRNVRQSMVNDLDAPKDKPRRRRRTSNKKRKIPAQ